LCGPDCVDEDIPSTRPRAEKWGRARNPRPRPALATVGGALTCTRVRSCVPRNGQPSSLTPNEERYTLEPRTVQSRICCSGKCLWFSVPVFKSANHEMSGTDWVTKQPVRLMLYKVLLSEYRLVIGCNSEVTSQTQAAQSTAVIPCQTTFAYPTYP